MYIADELYSGDVSRWLSTAGLLVCIRNHFLCCYQWHCGAPAARGGGGAPPRLNSLFFFFVYKYININCFINTGCYFGALTKFWRPCFYSRWGWRGT